LITSDADSFPVLRKPWSMNNLNSVLSISLDDATSTKIIM